MPDDLGLDDHAPLALPLAGRVPRLAEDVGGVATGLGEHAGPAHQPPTALFQPAVAGHGHEVFDALGLEALEDPSIPATPPVRGGLLLLSVGQRRRRKRTLLIARPGHLGGARWRGASIAHLKARRTLAGLSCGVLRRLYATGGKGEEAEEVLACVHEPADRLFAIGRTSCSRSPEYAGGQRAGARPQPGPGRRRALRECPARPARPALTATPLVDPGANRASRRSHAHSARLSNGAPAAEPCGGRQLALGGCPDAPPSCDPGGGSPGPLPSGSGLASGSSTGRSGTAASSRGPRARRCGSATRTGRRGRRSPSRG
jgi:hypothetical protein